MNVSGTAFFIEPRGTLRALLQAKKAELEAALPGQPYTSHPPHCTLLFGGYGAPTSWLKPLREKLAGVAPFELETDQWQLFPNDTLAGGGQTVAIRVRPSPALFELQRVIAECVGPHLEIPASSHPLALREPFATSLKCYGFPFVGEHWIAHFTIGSPRVGSTDPLLSRLQEGNPRHRFVVHVVSVWKVTGDHHDREHELALGRDQFMTAPDAETS